MFTLSLLSQKKNVSKDFWTVLFTVISQLLKEHMVDAQKIGCFLEGRGRMNESTANIAKDEIISEADKVMLENTSCQVPKHWPTENMTELDQSDI